MKCQACGFDEANNETYEDSDKKIKFYSLEDGMYEDEVSAGHCETPCKFYFYVCPKCRTVRAE